MKKIIYSLILFSNLSCCAMGPSDLNESEIQTICEDQLAFLKELEDTFTKPICMAEWLDSDLFDYDEDFINWYLYVHLAKRRNCSPSPTETSSALNSTATHMSKVSDNEASDDEKPLSEFKAEARRKVYKFHPEHNSMDDYTQLPY